MERWVAKLISLVLIFSSTLICTLLPIKVADIFIRKGAQGLRVLSYFMCFGGGVFFAIYILHMSPDVKDLLDAALIKPYNINYPVAELVISLGFFLMLFLEKITIKAYKSHDKHEHVRHYEMQDLSSKQEVTSKQDVNSSEIEGKNGKLVKDRNDSDAKESLIHGSITNDFVNKNPDGTVYIKQPDVDITVEHELPHNHLQGSRSLILLLALSLHHVFEGISVGLKHTNTGVWNLTIAIISHEVIIAFSLGLQLVKTYKSTRMIVFAATLCSGMTPLGVAIGMGITETGNSGNSALDITNGILQGIATGVFIYVTFFEILHGEISHHDTSILKLVFLLMGFVVMALLGIIPEDLGSDLPPVMSNGTMENDTCICA